ncbi:trimethylamine methyltransferase family protein [Candidatus Latescibacterota bacterium]
MQDTDKRAEKISFKLISNESVRKIHNKSLEILEVTGVRIQHDKALRMLDEAGAKVNHTSKMVCFPPDMIEQSLETAPKSMLFAARNKIYDFTLQSDGSTFTRTVTGSAGYIDDLNTGEHRKIVLSDLKNWARLVDGLENINYLSCVFPDDVPLATREIHIFMAMLENTGKHLQTSAEETGNIKILKYIIEIASTIVGGKKELRKRPIFNSFTAAFSPLIYPEIVVDIILLSGEYGIPLELAVCPIAGATGPVTPVGLVLQASVELLAGVVISQVANPGAPLVISPRLYFLNMRNGNIIGGNIESAMVSTMQAQLINECYGLPVCLSGPGTDSMLADEQSMIERVYHTLLPALAGVNILACPGLVEHASTISPVQLTIDNDIIGMAQQILKGFSFDEDVLGIDTINGVGPGGNFLTEDHTLKYFKTEYKDFPLFNRMNRDNWKNSTMKDFKERARNKASDILRNHQIPLLDEKLLKELRLIVQEAEKNIV